MAKTKGIKLPGVTITKVFANEEKEGDYGPYTPYDIYVDDPDWKSIKFRYNQSSDKPVPRKGMKIDLYYTTNEKGDKVYYNCQSIEPLDGEKPKPKGTESKPTSGASGAPASRQESRPAGIPSRDDPWWFCLAYAKDLMINHPAVEKGSPAEAADSILAIADRFYAHIPAGSSKPQEKPTADGKGEGQGQGKKQRTWPEYAQSAKKNMTPEAYKGVCDAYSVKDLLDIPAEQQEDALKDIANYFKAQKA